MEGGGILREGHNFQLEQIDAIFVQIVESGEGGGLGFYFGEITN